MPVIATNMAAISAGMHLNKNSREQASSLAKLSSGSKIVRASDDAAGLAISTSLQADITTLKQAATNIQQAISVLQTADGAAARAHDIWVRIKALSAQANSGSIDTVSFGFIGAEASLIYNEANSLRVSTQFNGISLMNGSYGQDFQVGVNVADTINVSIPSLPVQFGFSIIASNRTLLLGGFQNTLNVNIDSIQATRAIIGSYLSRFETRGDVVDTSIENLVAAKSAITDVDIAAEQTNLTSKQILTESSIAALAQANQMTSDLLALMR